MTMLGFKPPTILILFIKKNIFYPLISLDASSTVTSACEHCNNVSGSLGVINHNILRSLSACLHIVLIVRREQ